MSAPIVESRCGCGHSAAAHSSGPCLGVDLFGNDRADQNFVPRGASLCRCREMHERRESA